MRIRAFCCTHTVRQVSTSSLSKDYYQVLGLQRDATQRQIKNAYYQLSKKYHPDVAGRNAGTESKFIEITEAYECLKDPERRRIYDGSSVGRGGRYTETSSDFKQYYGQRRNNPFYSKRYTQQEYERIWEQFNRMRAEREEYDARMRREGERIWEQFARERATRWQQFHSRYPNGPPGSMRYEWRWSSDPTSKRNIAIFTRILTFYMVCFVLVTMVQIISEPFFSTRKAQHGSQEKRSMVISEQPIPKTTFDYMQQPPSSRSDGWNDVITSSSSFSENPDSVFTTKPLPEVLSLSDH